jgi:hypothetical protein
MPQRGLELVKLADPRSADVNGYGQKLQSTGFDVGAVDESHDVKVTNGTFCPGPMTTVEFVSQNILRPYSLLDPFVAPKQAIPLLPLARL